MIRLYSLRLDRPLANRVHLWTRPLKTCERIRAKEAAGAAEPDPSGMRLGLCRAASGATLLRAETGHSRWLASASTTSLALRPDQRLKSCGRVQELFRIRKSPLHTYHHEEAIA
jgi:hypothetical protein